jgi:NADH:ubiquinone oxidoreductase subunit 3 (subunit A)
MSDAYLHQYLFIGLLTGVAILLGVAPLILARFVAPKKPGASKQAPYECGLESRGEPWVQFNVQYYTYALLFVIFDVEAVFLIPWALVWRETLMNPAVIFLEMALFIAILAVGLIYAWKKGVLEWE